MVTAQFGTKKFQVSNKILYTPNGVSVSEELDIEETEVSGKKPTVKIKGIKLQSMSFEVKLDARFVDVETEIRYWKNTLLAKKSQQFKLGVETIGKFFLVKYDLKDIKTNRNGRYVAATITLSFTEDGEYVNKQNDAASKKAEAVKSSASTSTNKNVRVGSVFSPKKGVRWYETAEGAIKKSGKSGKAYQQPMTIKHIYKKNNKVVCVNPLSLGWLKIEDGTVVKY